MRSHFDPSIAFDLFRLIRRIDISCLESTTLLNFVLLSAVNGAVTAAQTVEILDAINEYEVRKVQPSGNARASIANENAVKRESPTVEVHEPSAFRILAKCARECDALSFAAALKFFHSREIISPNNRVFVELLSLHVHVHNGRLCEAMDVIEDSLDVDAAEFHPNAKSLFIQFDGAEPSGIEAKRVLLLNQYPVNALVRRLGLGNGSRQIDEVYEHLEKRHQQHRPVTTKSISILIAACAEIRDAPRACDLFVSFHVFRAVPTIVSYVHVLRSYSDPQEGLRHHEEMLSDATKQGLDCTLLIKAMLAQCEQAFDVEAALRLVAHHVRCQVQLDRLVIFRLLKQLCRLSDATGVRTIFDAMHALGQRIDNPVVSMCITSLRQCGVPCDDLRRYHS
jgi:hypothetical protein